MKLSWRQKRVVDAIGEALDDASASYDRARAGDDRIDESLEFLRSAPNLAVFDRALNFASDLDALYPIGRYRIAWVLAARDGLRHLTIEQHRLSEDAAEEKLKAVELEYQGRLGKNPRIWALSAPRDEVVSLLAQLARDLGLNEESTLPHRPEEMVFWRGVILADEGITSEARRLYEQAADMGEPKAMVNLGGLELEQGNIAAAHAWFEQAAALGEPRAYHNLGVTSGQSVGTDEAEEWFRRAAKAGVIESMLELSRLRDAAGDEAGSRRWLTEAAGAGSAEAMFYLGLRLDMRGDADGAAHWYEQSAALGSSSATFNLARVKGRLGDVEGERRLILQAAEMGSPDAANSLGITAMEDGNFEEAEKWFHRAAETGHAEAMNNLGVVYRDTGRIDEAIPLFEQAAEAGVADAASSVAAACYEEGDFAAAARWLRPFWEKAEPTAVHNVEHLLDTLRSQPDKAEADHDLGVVYMELGRDEESMEHFRRAAAAGYAKSMNNLGVIAVRQGDADQAREWFRQAALAGDSAALDNLERLSKEELR